VCSHAKNPAAGLNHLNNEKNENGEALSAVERSREESMRAERIARSVNKSSFMGLGSNPPKLYSEGDVSLVKRVQINSNTSNATLSKFTEKSETYLTDDSVPAAIYELIDNYRDKARNAKPGDQLALLIDDFFAECHQISKDAHLREIARIRNENSVEITRLRKVIESKNEQYGLGGSRKITAKENYAANHSTFADNEV